MFQLIKIKKNLNQLKAVSRTNTTGFKDLDIKYKSEPEPNFSINLNMDM